MLFLNEYRAFARVGTEKPRSYYIPFDEKDEFSFYNKILNRQSSSRFLSLDGVWEIKEHFSLNDEMVDEHLDRQIPVPSCVQMHGFDQIQYLNARYPFFYDPPYIPDDTPVYHYRKTFTISDLSERYYLNFEGVDSGFYVFVNGKKVGYGQIAHSTNEFEVTSFLKAGENTLDVIVLKWCAGTYLECQDKFRFTGIFRSVYLLKRPQVHIQDYKINTYIDGENGVIEVVNESEVAFSCMVMEETQEIPVGDAVRFIIKNASFWTAENPVLYDVVLCCNGEKILNRVGVRTVTIENGIFKINGKHSKLKGVNRHEFHPETGMSVTVEDTKRDLELMKWANVNAIRTSHYPDMPEFYDLADVYGFYLIDEADVETHGVFNSEKNVGFHLQRDAANSGIFDDGVLDREINLLERDKNRTSVVIWSLGNECCFGKMFFEGAEYIRKRDSRPIHYEGVETVGTEEYYTDRVDVLGTFYPSMEYFDKYLNDEKEKRPLVLCEYLHAMGNSCGELNDYWQKIYSNDRFMGAFVWEWCDQAIKTEKGFLYGGDFGETKHDGNFCVDGLVTPDRQVKSNLLELRAMYGSDKAIKLFEPSCRLESVTYQSPTSYELTENGNLRSLGNYAFKKPFTLNVLRANTDNDACNASEWKNYQGFKNKIYARENTEYGERIVGKVVVDCLKPLLEYELIYNAFDGGIDITVSYKINEHVSCLPRVGFEFALEKTYNRFQYVGYGETESYIDKRLSSYYGEYCSTAEKNYYLYIKPQETGSHYGTTRLEIQDLLEITAEKPFSFSVLPYSTKQISEASHDFELPCSDGVYVNVDLAMSGVGTASCGPRLQEKYRVPREGKNTFRFVLKQ